MLGCEKEITLGRSLYVSVISVEILNLEYCIQFQCPYSLKREIKEKAVELTQESDGNNDFCMKEY